MNEQQGTQTGNGNKVKTETHDPSVPQAWSAFMRQGWADRDSTKPASPVAAPAARRRQALAEALPGETLVLPAGGYKVRAHDTNYRFRADTAHAYFSGNQTSDAVLVIEPSGESVLYVRPRSGRDTDEFFRDRDYGALWAGERPSLLELSTTFGIECRHVDELADRLLSAPKTRVLRGIDPRVDALALADAERDRELGRIASELRLVKDDWELGELAAACDATTLGFEDSVREWDNVLKYGERWIEGTFFRRARAMGNDIGYDSIVGGGSHATTLHWIDNTGPITPGELVLLDMGVEGHHLYTADVTRTLPVDGTFTPLQRDLYSLVFHAQEAGIAAVQPGAKFLAAHQAAMEVLAHGLDDMGLLPVSAEEALDPDSKVYSRWTLHGTSHMLGMDVHDCGAAAPEAYTHADLAPGMVLTVEPGLYFQADDLLVPEELRGIGIRIEDDIVVTDDGNHNLSEALLAPPTTSRRGWVNSAAAEIRRRLGTGRGHGRDSLRAVHRTRDDRRRRCDRAGAVPRPQGSVAAPQGQGRLGTTREVQEVPAQGCRGRNGASCAHGTSRAPHSGRSADLLHRGARRSRGGRRTRLGRTTQGRQLGRHAGEEAQAACPDDRAPHPARHHRDAASPRRAVAAGVMAGQCRMLP
ncbi:aminopeptidase P family protein [Nocardioides alcanivorans]|uniref:aminopeptidase P family protein n=1 Tax=Nocardioides alcanivorans TaxID=2897352 RepID=UPI001F33D6E3|nr:aminopeptidase P family protein [Nocardioides alcanivorans]